MFLLGCQDGIGFTSLAIVLVNLVGLDKYPKAMTFGELSKIPATLIAGPAIGWLVDTTGNYTGAFLVAGSSAGMTTLLGFTIELLSHLRRRKRRSESVQHQMREIENKENNHVTDNLTV